MKKIIGLLMAVLTIVLAASVTASAYSGDPTSTGYYSYDNYGYNNYDGYTGLRPYNSYNEKNVPSWLEYEAEEYGATFYVSPNAAASRGDVFLSVARMLENKFERDGITFSSSYGRPFVDLASLDEECLPLVNGLVNRGIMRGCEGNTARFDRNITRAEFAAIINRLAHLTGKIEYSSYGYYNNGYSMFSDTKGHWAESVIAETAQYGMMSGVGNGIFAPEANVTYAQLFKVLTTFTDDDFELQQYDVAYGCTNTWDVDFDVEEDETTSGQKITSLTAEEKTIYVNIDDTTTTKVRINPSNAKNKNLTWESDSERIASIEDYYTKSNYGYVEVAGNKVGSTTIVGSATDGSRKTVTIKVVVTDGEGDTEVTSIKVNPSEVELEVGGTQTIKATVYPTSATNKDLIWESNNKKVATVSSSGKITAVGVGFATITVTSEDNDEVIATIDVTVVAEEVGSDDYTAPVVEITGADNVSVGEKVTLTVKVDEENLENFEITESDLLGLTGGASINKIKKVSDDTYEITLMGVEVSSLALCIDSGVAVDAAGNESVESNEVIIFINSGEGM